MMPVPIKHSPRTPALRSSGFLHVKYLKHDRVAYITLDRPDVLNAMNLRMHEELKEILDDFEKDDKLLIAVLTGAGGRSFSVGQDLSELNRQIDLGAAPTTFGSRGCSGFPRLTERWSLVKPVIARVDGYAIGGGFELAMACDLIIATDRSSFALPEARLGLIPGAGGLFRLTRQIPLKIAMGYLMTGRRMDAQRAYELGLINEVVPASELDSCIERWLADILACAPSAIRSLKQVSQLSAHLSLPAAFANIYDAEERRRLGSDSKEGVRAFMEKRMPNWE